MNKETTNGETSSAVTRLQHDYLSILKDPVPYILAEPMPSDLLKWHYVIKGPEETPYEGGFYHGKLIFPKEYPFKPPAICMITPNGRFQVNTRLCLSISDYHPDTWNPVWNVSTILLGLLSFMTEECPTSGSISTTKDEKKRLAASSLEYNLRNKTFCELFPETVETIQTELKRRKENQSKVDAGPTKKTLRF